MRSVYRELPGLLSWHKATVNVPCQVGRSPAMPFVVPGEKVFSKSEVYHPGRSRLFSSSSNLATEPRHASCRRVQVVRVHGWEAIYFKPLSTKLGDEVRHRRMSSRLRGGPWTLSPWVDYSTEPRLGVKTMTTLAGSRQR